MKQKWQLFYYNILHFKLDDVITVYLIIVYKIRVIFSLSCFSRTWESHSTVQVSYWFKFTGIFLKSMLTIVMVKSIWECGTILQYKYFQYSYIFFTLKWKYMDLIYIYSYKLILIVVHL